MAITLTGTGGFFTRMGKRLYALQVLNEFRGQAGSVLATDAPAVALADLVTGDGSALAIRRSYDQLPAGVENLLAAMAPFTSLLQGAAETLLIEQVHADRKLAAKDKYFAMRELIRQMNVAAATIQANAVAASVAAGSGNVGDGVLLVSLLNADGYALENALAEGLDVAITNTDTPGSETLEILGEVAADDPLGPNWPAGSGSRGLYVAQDAAGDDNLALNGAFEDFTADVPADWSIEVGAAGTDVLEETSTVFAGDACLRLVGDGSTLVRLEQETTALQSRVVYGLNFWARMSAAAAAGELTIDLYDPVTAAVTTDEAGNDNELVIDLTALSHTAWINKQVAFRLAEPAAATLVFRIHFSTALESTKAVLLDHLFFGPIGQQYDGGPFIAGYSGATPFCLDDTFRITVTNDRAGKFQTGFEQLYGMSAMGLLLPSVPTSPSISNSLIG